MYTVICSAKLRPCLCGLIQKFLSLKCLKDITFLSVEHGIPHNSFFFSRACILPDHCHATVSYNKRQHLFFPKYFPNCSPNSVNMDLIPLSFTFALPSPPSNPNFQKTIQTLHCLATTLPKEQHFPRAITAFHLLPTVFPFRSGQHPQYTKLRTDWGKTLLQPAGQLHPHREKKNLSPNYSFRPQLPPTPMPTNSH